MFAKGTKNDDDDEEREKFWVLNLFFSSEKRFNEERD